MRIKLLVLSLFTIVSWKQGPCTSTAGTNGTCYSSNECTNLGGEERDREREVYNGQLM